MMRRFPTASLIASSALVLGGCWSYSPGAGMSERAVALGSRPEIEWPARDTAVLHRIVETTAPVQYRYELGEGADDTSLNDEERAALKIPETVIAYQGVHGLGVVRVFADPLEESIRAAIGGGRVQRLDPLAESVFGFVPNATFFTSRGVAAAMRPEQVAQRQRQAARDRRRAPRGLRVIDRSEEFPVAGGMPVRLPDPSDHPVRGLILHFTAIAGNDFEPQVMDHLRARGWAVIDLHPETQVQAPVSPAARARMGEIEDQIDAEFERLGAGDPRPGRRDLVELSGAAGELLKEYRELRRGAFEVCGEADIPGVAKELAGQIDESLASAAYAGEAVLDYCRSQRPELLAGPVVLMGFSAGALVTPTVAARLGDRVDAVVLIGGGVDLFRISQESVFADGGVRLRCANEKIPRDLIDRLDGAYLEASRLDPYHTVPRLRGRPLLLLHGEWDDWVSARCGELLYERAGRPDRMRILGGHELLFYFLPDKARFIGDWLERAVTRRG